MVDIEEREEDEEPADWVQWAEDSSIDDKDIVYLALGNETEVEQLSALNELINGWNLQSN